MIVAVLPTLTALSCLERPTAHIMCLKLLITSELFHYVKANGHASTIPIKSVGEYMCVFVFVLQVVIIKPMTSCPTSPERFLVCRGFLGCKSILTEVGHPGDQHILGIYPRRLLIIPEGID